MQSARPDYYIVNDLFKKLSDKNIEYCILRNYESLPEIDFGSDIDILVNLNINNSLKIFANEFTSYHGLSIYYDYIDDRFYSFYASKKLNTGKIFSLKVDFFYNTELYGVKLINGDVILKSKLRYKDYYISDEVYTFLDKWLFTFLLQKDLPNKYHILFKDIFLKNRIILLSILEIILGKSLAVELSDVICATGFSNLPKLSKSRMLLILLNAIARDPFYHIWHLPLFIYYRCYYYLVPKGEFVSVSGPDGCGKTTVLDMATEQLQLLFGAVPGNHGHFRPSILPRIAQIAKRAGAIDTVDEKYDEPHRGKPSGAIGSLFRFFYYLLDYLIGYFFKIRPALVKRQMVIYDRYYFDMVADPGRSRIALPAWLRKAALSIIPLPHTAFFVHVPSDEVRKRKQELPVEKIEQLNAAYIEMVETSRLQILDNTSIAEKTAARLVNIVVERRRKRLGLDRIYP